MDIQDPGEVLRETRYQFVDKYGTMSIAGQQDRSRSAACRGHPVGLVGLEIDLHGRAVDGDDGKTGIMTRGLVDINAGMFRRQRGWYTRFRGQDAIGSKSEEARPNRCRALRRYELRPAGVDLGGRAVGLQADGPSGWNPIGHLGRRRRLAGQSHLHGGAAVVPEADEPGLHGIGRVHKNERSPISATVHNLGKIQGGGRR